MTFKAKVSGLSAFRHSTTVENSPSPNLRSTSYGPTHVSVSNFSAATDGGSGEVAHRDVRLGEQLLRSYRR